MEEIERFKTKIKNKKLIIETIEYDSSKLISDLNFEKGLIIKETKDIEIRLKKLKISEKSYWYTKRSLYTNLWILWSLRIIIRIKNANLFFN